MKKLRILTIALLLAISFVGCKDDDKESNCDKEIQDIIDQYGLVCQQCFELYYSRFKTL